MTGTTRREVMGGLVAGVAAVPMLMHAASARTQDKEAVMTAGKIDTHQHFLPKVYVDAVGLATLAATMPNKTAPNWSADSAIAMMDAGGIAQGIISISAGPVIPDAAVLLRKCNDEAAALRARHPGRFGSFASLPLPDVDASLSEITYALDTLKAEGVILFTNYGGRYLGDPVFVPVLDELNRRKAVVFIHPNSPSYAFPDLPPESVLEFPFDTTRTAASLIMSGAMKRFPDIRFILSHAGGTLPYLSQRLAGAVMMNPALGEKVGDPFEAIKAFWFDTALSMSKPAMAALMAVADPARILFGTDFPMAPGFAIRMSVEGLATMPMPEPLRAAIGRGNALALLERGVT